MSQKLPVISTNIGGISELVQDGVTGYLVSPGDTQTMLRYMVKLVHSPCTRRDLGEAGYRRFCSCFELERMVAKYQELMLFVAPPMVLIVSYDVLLL